MIDLKSLRRCLQGADVGDIAVCEAQSIDVNAWFIYLRLHNGEEIRLATATEAEAREDCAQINEWRGQMERGEQLWDPPKPPVSQRKRNWWLVWLGFWAVVVVLAVKSTDYSMVDGMVVVDHFLAGMAGAVVLFGALVWTVAPEALEAKTFLLGLPILVLMTFGLTFAAKAVNALAGPPEEITVTGLVTAMEDMSIHASVKQGDIDVPQSEITVRDAATGRTYTIVVPGWVAQKEGLQLGVAWHDHFYRGALGWYYRRGMEWNEKEAGVG